MSTLNFFNNKTDVVRYVTEMLPISETEWPWTMTITLGKYGEFYASIATGTSSEDIEGILLNSLNQPMNILHEITPVG